MTGSEPLPHDPGRPAPEPALGPFPPPPTGAPAPPAAPPPAPPVGAPPPAAPPSVPPAADTSSPYLGLASFGPAQARYFFGRERDTRLVASNLLAFRLTVLYGPSGVGKSSLLAAAVVPEVLRRVGDGARSAPPLAVYLKDWRDDPALLVEQGVRAAAARAGIAVPGEAAAEGSLRERLEAWADVVGSELYLVFDQFEDFFLYHEEDSWATRNLGEALGADIPLAHVLISLREDALAKLDRFQDEVPTVLENTYRLAHLTREQATSAVTGPIEVRNAASPAGPLWRLEPGLVDEVLDQVRVGSVIVGASGEGQVARDGLADAYETAHLQLVMHRLWQEEQRLGSTELRRATLAGLGGAKGIVESHLTTTLAGLSRRELDITARAFTHLVTPSGTKIAHDLDDLAEYADAPPAATAAVMEKLAAGDRRILRTVPPSPNKPDVARYEIFHDALGSAISRWRDEHEHRRAGRRRRRIAALVSGTAIVLAVALIASFVLLARTNEQRREQESRSLSLQAEAAIDADQRLAAELAAAAWDVERTPEAERAVRRVASAQHLDSTLDIGDGPVGAVAMAPDGTRVLTGSDGGATHLWTATGTGAEPGPRWQARAIDSADRAVTFAVSSPDGEHVATITADRTLHLYRWDDGTEVASTEAGTLDPPAFSPDGSKVVAPSLAEGVVLLSTDGTTERIGDDWYAWGVSFLDDDTLAVHDRDSVFLADLDGAVTATADTASADPAPLYEITAVAADGDAGIVAAGDLAGNAWVWDTRDGSVPTAFRTGRATQDSVSTLEFAPGGRHLLVVATRSAELAPVGDDGTVGRPAVVSGQRDFVLSGRFTPDGSHVVLTAEDRAVLVDATSGQLVDELRQGDGQPLTVASAVVDGAVSFVVGGTDGKARVWRYPVGRTYRGFGDWVLTAVVDRERGQLVAGGTDGTLRRWDLATAEELPAPDAFEPVAGFDASGSISQLEMAPDGRHLLGVSADSGYAWIRDLAAEGAPVVESLVFPGRVNRATFGADADHVVVVSGTDVLVWDRTDEARADVVTNDLFGPMVARSPGGERHAIGWADGRVETWDMESRERIASVDAHDDGILDMAFSADGARLATISLDRSLALWDVGSDGALAEAGRFGLDEWPLAVAWSPDGGQVLVGTQSGRLLVRDADDGTLLHESDVHSDAINEIVPVDGGRYLTVGDDRVVRTWQCTTCVSTAELVTRLRAVARSGSSAEKRPAPAAKAVPGLQLAPGMCIRDPMPTATFYEEPVVPCDQTHAQEVFGVWLRPENLPDPVPQPTVTELLDTCTERFFAAYVGTDPDTSRYKANVTWGIEGRRITCRLVRDDGEAWRGTARGSGD